MSAEYEIAKNEAMQRLASACLQNLQRIKEEGVEAEFSFFQELAYQERDNKMRPQWPVAKQFSAIVDHQSVPTWYKYSYSNGELKSEKVQHERVVHWTPDDFYRRTDDGITIEKKLN